MKIQKEGLKHENFEGKLRANNSEECKVLILIWSSLFIEKGEHDLKRAIMIDTRSEMVEPIKGRAKIDAALREQASS